MRADERTIATGENGEFHTMVTAGPIFRGRIEITDTRIEKENGHLFHRIDKLNVRG